LWPLLAVLTLLLAAASTGALRGSFRALVAAQWLALLIAVIGVGVTGYFWIARRYFMRPYAPLVYFVFFLVLRHRIRQLGPRGLETRAA
jgi:hypothetical protein